MLGARPRAGPQAPTVAEEGGGVRGLPTVESTEREGSRWTPEPSSPPDSRSCGLIRLLQQRCPETRGTRTSSGWGGDRLPTVLPLNGSSVGLNGRRSYREPGLQVRSSQRCLTPVHAHGLEDRAERPTTREHTPSIEAGPQTAPHVSVEPIAVTNI